MFSIFTLNCNDVPFSSNREERMKKLIEFLVKKRYDVICLQEVWTNRSLHSLVSHLPNYQWVYTNERTGLFIMSLHPITSQYYERFHHQNKKWNLSMESIAERGFQAIDINYLGKTIHIINTHLQSKYSKKEKEYYTNIRKEQLKQLLRYMDILDSDTFLIGDLNCVLTEWKPIFQERLKNLAYNIGYTHKYGKIDHILCSYSIHNYKSSVQLYPSIVSDHNGIECLIYERMQYD